MCVLSSCGRAVLESQQGTQTLSLPLLLQTLAEITPDIITTPNALCLEVVESAAILLLGLPPSIHLSLGILKKALRTPLQSMSLPLSA